MSLPKQHDHTAQQPLVPDSSPLDIEEGVLSRSKSNSIIDHYSLLRNGTTPSNSGSFSSEAGVGVSVGAAEIAHLNSNSSNCSAPSSFLSSSLPSSLSPVLGPVKKVIVKNINSIAENSGGMGLKSYFKKKKLIKTLRSPTAGPITKLAISPNDEPNFEDLSLDPFMLGNDNELIIDPPKVPEIFIDEGLTLLRVTRKKKTPRVFKIDIENALVTWNNGSKAMSLDKIQQIRTDEDARNYREEYGISKEYDDRWATIIYNKLGSNKLKALHIIAPTREIFELFITTLTNLVTRRRELMKYLAISGENFANIHWRNYVSRDDQKSEKLLSYDDILKLTKRLHINYDEKLLLKLLRETDINCKHALNFDEFQNFVKKLKIRPEIIQIFSQITKNEEEVLYKEEFIKFIKEVQKQKDDDEVIQRIFTKFSDNGLFLTLDNFKNFITSSNVLSTSNVEEEDMSRPINEYFISSSHNTFLLGRQYGKSPSLEAYVKVLQRGCRSIEIDIWDGDQGPSVRHGKLTGSLSVKDVFEVIRKYAFIMTPYPLFLSFDIHCKTEYQYKVRDLLFEVFGDFLVTKPLVPGSTTLPSPMDLKHKILVKAKRTDQNDDSSSNSQNNSTVTSSSTAQEEVSNDESQESGVMRKMKRKRRFQTKIIPELSELAVYASGLNFTNFSLPESKTMNHIFSFSESTFDTMIKDPEKDYLIRKHNRRFLMRVYPAGLRYNSTNFIPIKHWNYGVQMVATNWQTYDIGQQVNEAMFNRGKRSGYVLKPEVMRDTQPNLKFKLLASSPPSTIRFKIDIISGQLLTRPLDLKPDDPLSPYVSLEFVDSKILNGGITITELDSNLKSVILNNCASTKVIHANGFNPVWNCRFEGQLESVAGLDFIRFLVKTGDITFAVNCVRLNSLNQGYRHIPLYDLQGEEYIFSTLFINVNYEKVS